MGRAGQFVRPSWLGVLVRHWWCGAGGHGTGFCIGNILKYAQRYGKKGSREDARKDLLKVLHYAIIQLHVHDQEL